MGVLVQMMRYIKRFVAGMLLCLLSLFVLGFGLCVITAAVEEYVFPWVMSFPPSQVTVLDNPSAVAPALEGRVVEVHNAPVQCDTMPEDESFGVCTRAVFMRRHWNKEFGNRRLIPDKVGNFEMMWSAATPEFRVGPYRAIGKQAQDLLHADILPVSISRIPDALRPYHQATEPPSFQLPEHGVLSPVYYGVPDGARISYIGRQIDGALLVDDEVNNVVYWRWWWQLDDEAAEEARFGLLKAAFFLWGAYVILLVAVWMGNRGVQMAFGGWRLFGVSSGWPAMVLLAGASGLILLAEIRSRTPFYDTEPWEYGIGITLLCILVVLGMVRRKPVAS
ncbi:MAG: hypothetical protein IJ498_03500 [Akkermansia sp.]|nr:hypothetical protein [Akkermansia sp.]